MNNDIIDVLAGDPFYYNIIDYLKSDDIYNLLQTCQYYKKSLTLSLLKKQTMKEMNNRFHELFGNLTPEFKKIIKELECVVTGSFILQCILGLYWLETDMDIYIESKKEDEKSKTTLDYFLIDKMGYKIIKETSSYSESIAGINEVRTYDKKDSSYKVQIIMVTVEDNLHNYVESNFDFDICKNIYSIDKNNKESLTIYKINEILSRKTKFALNNKNRVGSSVERCKKYQKRGFDFTNKNTLTYKDFKHANIFEVTKLDIDTTSYQLVDGDMNELKEIITNKQCLYKYNKSYGDYITLADSQLTINKQVLKPCDNLFGICIISNLCYENPCHCHLDAENKNIIVINNKFMKKKHCLLDDDTADLEDYEECEIELEQQPYTTDELLQMTEETHEHNKNIVNKLKDFYGK